MSGDYYIAVTSQILPKTVNHYRQNEAFALFRIPETFKKIFSLDLKHHVSPNLKYMKWQQEKYNIDTDHLIKTKFLPETIFTMLDSHSRTRSL